jgi:hypothetical protein
MQHQTIREVGSMRTPEEKSTVPMMQHQKTPVKTTTGLKRQH